MNKFEIVNDYKQSRPLDFLKSLRDNPELAGKEKLLALIKEMIKLITNQKLKDVGRTIIGFFPGVKKTEESFKYEDSKAFYADMKRVFEGLEINDRYFDDKNLERYEILKQFIGEDIKNKNVQISELGSFFIDDKKYGVISDLEMQKFFSRINKDELEAVSKSNFNIAKTNGFYIIDASNEIYQNYQIQTYENMKEVEKILNNSEKEESNIILYHGIAFDKETQTIIKVYPDLVDDPEIFNNGKFIIPKEIEGIKVENLGEKAFYGYGDELRKIIVPEMNGTIGKSCFAKNDYLEDVLLPTTLTEIPNYCFYKCPSLLNIEIPSTVTRIGEFAFEHGESLIELKLPEGLTEIGDSAFEDCINLSNMQLNSSLETIGNRAFYNSGLCEVTFPDTTKSVGRQAFSECKYLSTINLSENVRDYDITAFSHSRVETVNTPADIPIYFKENIGNGHIEPVINVIYKSREFKPEIIEEMENYHNVVDIASIPENDVELVEYEERTSLKSLSFTEENITDNREKEAEPTKNKTRSNSLER